MILKIHQDLIGDQAFTNLQDQVIEGETYYGPYSDFELNSNQNYSNEDRALDILKYLSEGVDFVASLLPTKYKVDFNVADFVSAQNSKLNFSQDDLDKLHRGDNRIELYGDSVPYEYEYLHNRENNGLFDSEESIHKLINSVLSKDFDPQNSNRSVDEINEIIENVPNEFSDPVKKAFGDSYLFSTSMNHHKVV